MLCDLFLFVRHSSGALQRPLLEAILRIDKFELTLNESYEATPRELIEYYLGMHIQRDRKKRVLSLDAPGHVDEFIQTMGLDPHTSSSVSTPLNPAVTYSHI